MTHTVRVFFLHKITLSYKITLGYVNNILAFRASYGALGRGRGNYILEYFGQRLQHTVQ